MLRNSTWQTNVHSRSWRSWRRLGKCTRAPLTVRRAPLSPWSHAAEADFLERYRNSKVTTHNLKVLLRMASSLFVISMNSESSA